MRILVLNQAYHPDVVATAQHAHDAALHLARAGHEVHVIASRSLYNGRGATLPASELIDGVQVHRVGLSLFGKTTLLLRGVDSALFLLLSCLKALTLPRPDVTLALCNPPFMAANRTTSTRAIAPQTSNERMGMNWSDLLVRDPARLAVIIPSAR